MKERFGFIGYPLSFDLLRKFNPYFNQLSETEAKKALLKIPPFKASEILGVKSKTGAEIIGDFILIMLLPDQILEYDRDFVLNRIIEAGKIAESLGDKIIGLGGLTSVIGQQGEIVAKHLNIAVTTGNTFTAAETIEAVLKASNIMGISLSDSKACIVGASGSIGSACSYILSKKVKYITLVARNLKRLNALADSLKTTSKANIATSIDVKESIANSDVVIFATSCPETLVDISDFKAGALVCDTSVPRNISRMAQEKRKDLIIIDGGLVRPPGKMYINFDMGLPQGYAYACLCETMILTMENRFENFTLGSGISTSKLDEITSLSVKHGFKLDKFNSFGQPITERDLINVGKYSKMMPNTKI